MSRFIDEYETEGESPIPYKVVRSRPPTRWCRFREWCDHFVFGCLLVGLLLITLLGWIYFLLRSASWVIKEGW